MLMGRAPQAGEAATPKPILITPYAARGKGSNPRLQAQPLHPGSRGDPQGSAHLWQTELAQGFVSAPDTVQLQEKQQAKSRADATQRQSKPRACRAEILTFSVFGLLRFS